MGEDGLTRLGVAGALCREYASDEHAFLAFLAQALDEAFGPAVERLFDGGFLRKKFRGVCFTYGDARYQLEDTGTGSLKASITHVVRGIALKTETVKVQDWLEIISEIAEQAAAEHGATRKALQDMLGLS